MKYLGVADVILGIKITRTTDGISLSQSLYMDKMIERFKDHGIKENTNPFHPHVHLHKNTGTRICQLEHSQIIGSLMYLMNYTRPNIAYAVIKLSRYTSNPSDDHWTTLLRVLGYVSHTKEYALRMNNIHLYLKDTAMLIGLQILRNQNQLADTYLLLEEQRYLENLSNKSVLPVPQWNQNS